MSVLFENWYQNPHVRAAIQSLLLYASDNFSPRNRMILQVLGEPFAHDPSLFFMHTYFSIPSSCKPYTVVADCDALPFKAGLFDVVFLVFPYEQMGDHTKWVEELERVLSPYGVMAVFSINPLSIDGIIDRMGVGRLPKGHTFMAQKLITQALSVYDLKPIAQYHTALWWQYSHACPVPRFVTKQAERVSQMMGVRDWPEGIITLDVYGYDRLGFIGELAVL